MTLFGRLVVIRLYLKAYQKLSSSILSSYMNSSSDIRSEQHTILRIYVHTLRHCSSCAEQIASEAPRLGKAKPRTRCSIVPTPRSFTGLIPATCPAALVPLPSPLLDPSPSRPPHRSAVNLQPHTSAFLQLPFSPRTPIQTSKPLRKYGSSIPPRRHVLRYPQEELHRCACRCVEG
jgi:hypothetical protein